MTDFDKYIAFITSYIIGEIPVLQDGKFERDSKSLFNRIEECYSNALKKWVDGNEIRERLASKKYASISQLKDLYTATEWKSDAIALKCLTYLWAEELLNDKECSHYIQGGGTNEEVVSNKIRILSINYEEHSILQHIHRGLREHNKDERYIRRYCSLEQSGSDSLSYILGDKEKNILMDYVFGIQNPLINKFILYSSAQTGKTTELKQLCWELQESGLCLPLYFEVRTNTKLQREQLPYLQYVEGKEIVIVIDALDEVNGKVYDDLLEEIKGFATDHPEMKMVLSCRNNYRKESNLDIFTTLYLEELSRGDIKNYIDKTIGKDNRLFANIIDNQLIDFAKNPFFLKILIEVYTDNNKQLPKTKADLYRLFFERSYRYEKKVVSSTIIHNIDESIHLLERIALVLSLMNKQSLSKAELFECLNNNESDLEECLRFDLIQCEEDNYSFKQSAFREWLVASYLYEKGFNKTQQLASHPSGKIKKEWYNIIILWLSLFDKNRHQEISDVLYWLEEAGLDMIVHIDKDLLEKNKRNDLFKIILLHYKELGIRMSNLTTRDYTNLLSFSQSDDTVGFITKEIKSAVFGTAYYADLMCLCYFMDWHKMTEQTQTCLFEQLEQKVNYALNNQNSNDLTFLFFGNRTFPQDKYLERLFEIVKTSNYYEAISSMIRLINNANKVDDYLDYILDKEQYICDQQGGNSTLSVSRTPIYDALSNVVKLDSVKKVLKHKFPNVKYNFELKEYLKMMESIFNKISDFIKRGENNLINDVKIFYSSMFQVCDFYSYSDELHQDILKLLRRCYQDTEFSELERKSFYGDISTFFDSNNSDNIQKAFLTAALWMTTTDVKDDFDEFDKDNQYDRNKALWYCKVPFEEVAECANTLYNEKYFRTLQNTKWNEKQQNDFNEFADYNIFQHIVLSIIATLSNYITRRLLKDVLWSSDNNYNQYASQFILQYVSNDEEESNLSLIQRDINDRNVYETFFVKEVSGMILSKHLNYLVTDNAKERCIAYAKKCILNVCNGEQPTSFLETAISLMLSGYFELEEDFLYKLLDYGDLHIYTNDEFGRRTKRYYLFDYIKDRVDFENFNSLVINTFQEKIGIVHTHLLALFSTYVVENRIEEGYSLSLKYALSGDFDILDLIIKNKINLEDIKIGINQMNTSDKLSCYHLFIRHKSELEWVKQQLESEYLIYNGYDKKRAIVMLMNLGSVDALNYLVCHIELLENCNDLYFNFDCPKAINALCNLIKCDYINNCFERPFILDSILNSLENIALCDEDSFNEVRKQLNLVIQASEQFKYLHRFVNALENKYFTSQLGEKDINTVLKIIDADADDYVYISYKWEELSSVTVDYLCLVLETNGIPYKRDKKDCNYTDNIKEFMNAIRNGRFVIVVFSKGYLESYYCMYELSGILEWNNYEERLLPIRVDKDIKDDDYYVDLIKYWKQKKDEKEQLVNELMELDSSQVEPLEQKLKEIIIIYNLLPSIKQYIDSTNSLTLSKMSETRFEPIVCKITGIS